MLGFLIILGLVTGAVVLLWSSSHRGTSADAGDIGRKVVVAVARPTTADPLSKIGAVLARPVGGEVTPLTVLTTPVSRSGHRDAEQTVRHCEALIQEEGLDAGGRVRIASSLSDGVLHGLVEHAATSLVVGWPATAESGRFTASLEEIVAASPAPVLIARVNRHRWNRIVLRVPSEPLTGGQRASLRLATQTAERLGASGGIDVGFTRLVMPKRHDPAHLLVTPVTPDPAALPRIVASLEAEGDVVLALCHGPRATEHRPLLPSASALYDLGDARDLDPTDLRSRSRAGEVPARLPEHDGTQRLGTGLSAEGRR